MLALCFVAPTFAFSIVVPVLLLSSSFERVALADQFLFAFVLSFAPSFSFVLPVSVAFAAARLATSFAFVALPFPLLCLPFHQVPPMSIGAGP